MAGAGEPEKRRTAGDGSVPETNKKKAKTELDKLDFVNPGSKQAVPDWVDLHFLSSYRRTRSGKNYLPPVEVAATEVMEQEHVLTDRQGSLEERALHLFRIKGLQGFVDDVDDENMDGEADKRYASSSQCIIDAGERFEQQFADENSRVRRSVVLLGHNGNGKSFFINLAMQVRESLVH